MSAVAVPVFGSRKDHLAVAKVLLLSMVLLYLGLLSFAAVNSMKVECGPVYLTGGGKLLTGDGKLLTLGERCYGRFILDQSFLDGPDGLAGGLRVHLPAWLSDRSWWIAS
jgi:hypothetical protein